MIAAVAVALLFAFPAAGQKLHETCGTCHTQHATDFQEHTHFKKDLSCDACHGKSNDHLDANGNRPPDRVAGPSEQPAVCGACHVQQKPLYEASKHGKLVLARSKTRSPACTGCHGSHQLRKPAAMVGQCNRCHASLPAACAEKEGVPAKPGGLRCAGCHNPHSLSRS